MPTISLTPVAATSVNNADVGMYRLFLNSSDSDRLYSKDDTGVTAAVGSGIGNIIEDLTPELGGDLETNTFDILVETGDVIIFEGTTADAFETTLTVVDPTADRVISLPNATDTLVGKDTIDTLTNKSIDLTSNTLTFTSAQLITACSNETGTGLLVFATAPTLTNPIVGTQSAGDNSTKAASTAYTDNAVAKQTEVLVISCGDETTSMTTGTKVTFRMPFAMTLTSIRGSLTTAATGATLFAFDVKESGTTIFSTKPTLDASEKTTTTATTASVLSDSSLTDDAEMTIIVDAIGNTLPGVGLKVAFIGTRT